MKQVLLLFSLLFSTSFYAQSVEKKKETFTIYSVPVHPKCKRQKTPLENKECLSRQINLHFQKKFNTDIAEDVYPRDERKCLKEKLVYDKFTDSKELKCIKYEPILIKIYVIFKINKEGVAGFIKAKAVDQRFVEEAKRVIEKFPRFKPALDFEQQPAVVKYTKPISFRI